MPLKFCDVMPVTDIAVDKILSLRETLTAGHTDIFTETSCEEVKAVRKFKVPSMNENAASYHYSPGS